MSANRATEITSEMIEAGAQVVWQHFEDLIPYDSETGRWAAIEVFRAMEATRFQPEEADR